MKSTVIPLLCLSAFLLACASPTGEGRLVPPTVTEDSSLPSLSIVVQGQTRRIYYETWGDPASPALLVMPGSLSDVTPYEAFAAFSGDYYVVAWDQRGQGLSERVGSDELSYEAMVEEIGAVKAAFSPNAPVSLVGHSWSAFFAGLYAGEHPDQVAKLVLMEPFGFTSASMASLGESANLLKPGYLDMSWASGLVGTVDHDALDYRCYAMLYAAVRNYFKDPDNLPSWPVRRVGGLALATWEGRYTTELLKGYDYSSTLAAYTGSVLLVGSQYSPIDYDFQVAHNAPLFTGAAKVSSLYVQDSGHRMITEAWSSLEAGIAAFLKE